MGPTMAEREKYLSIARQFREKGMPFSAMLEFDLVCHVLSLKYALRASGILSHKKAMEVKKIMDDFYKLMEPMETGMTPKGIWIDHPMEAIFEKLIPVIGRRTDRFLGYYAGSMEAVIKDFEKESKKR